MPKSSKMKKPNAKLHWWSQLTVKGQRAYIKKHPDSMYARVFKPVLKPKWNNKLAKLETKKAASQPTATLQTKRKRLLQRMGEEHKAGNKHMVIDLQHKHDVVATELQRRTGIY